MVSDRLISFVRNTLALGKPRSGAGLQGTQSRHRRAFKVAHKGYEPVG